MRFLVTGIAGFVGAHVCDLLRREGHDVFGTTRGGTSPDTVGARLHLPPDHLVVATLADGGALTTLMRETRPDGVVHLAALTSVAASLNDPLETYRTNLLGSVNLFAAAHAARGVGRIIWIGSSDAYGDAAPNESAITETTPFRPLSPYAVSKAAADLAAYQWGRTHGLEIIRMRPFNHAGPGQSPAFVCADFARQIVAIERGALRGAIAVGNIDVVRDFTDVRDVARAYLLAWQHGRSGAAYNVCSGIGRTPRGILEGLLRLSGVRADIVSDARRCRATDVRHSVGDATSLRQQAGWTPVIPWEQTLGDVLDDWRTRAATGTS